MFFLPLPLSKTLETLEEVKPSSQIASKRTLPHPELYIMVNGQFKLQPFGKNILMGLVVQWLHPRVWLLSMLAV